MTGKIEIISRPQLSIVLTTLGVTSKGMKSCHIICLSQLGTQESYMGSLGYCVSNARVRFSGRCRNPNGFATQPIFLRDSVRIYKGQSGLIQVASGGVGQT